MKYILLVLLIITIAMSAYYIKNTQAQSSNPYAPTGAFLVIGTSSNIGLASTSKIFFDGNNGNFGIGTILPTTTLDINGTTTIQGKLGLNTYNPTQTLSVSGTSGLTGTTTITGYTNILGSLDVTGSKTTALVQITQNQAWNGISYGLTVNGYSNLGGFRVNGSDPNASFYLAGNHMPFAIDSNKNWIFNEFTGTAFNTKATLTTAGELSIAGLSSDGTGKIVCIKSNGYLGSCTTSSSSTGTCTCS